MSYSTGASVTYTDAAGHLADGAWLQSQTIKLKMRGPKTTVSQV